LLASLRDVGVAVSGRADGLEAQPLAFFGGHAQAHAERGRLPSHRAALHPLNQLRDILRAVPWRPDAQPRRDALFRVAILRDVLGGDVDVVAPGIVILNDAALPVVEEQAFQVGHAQIEKQIRPVARVEIVRPRPAAPPPFVFYRDVEV
jgi:hypothetical protein